MEKFQMLKTLRPAFLFEDQTEENLWIWYVGLLSLPITQSTSRTWTLKVSTTILNFNTTHSQENLL